MRFDFFGVSLAIVAQPMKTKHQAQLTKSHQQSERAQGELRLPEMEGQEEA
jgi:hypothetical protein